MRHQGLYRDVQPTREQDNASEECPVSSRSWIISLGLLADDTEARPRNVGVTDMSRQARRIVAVGLPATRKKI